MKNQNEESWLFDWGVYTGCIFIFLHHEAMKVIRTCYPPTSYSGTLVTLSLKQLRKSRCRKGSLNFPLYLKAGHKFLIRKMPSMSQEEKDLLITGDGALMPRWLSTYKPTRRTLIFYYFSHTFPNHVPIIYHPRANPLLLSLIVPSQVTVLC